ncbi:hypothetical protein JXR93_08070 [bacterium]|nr:hypothetical protein [bacterium]
MVNVNQLVGVVKNIATNPAGAIKELGETSRFKSVATLETFLFAALIPVAYLISWFVVGFGGGRLGRIRMPFVHWVNNSMLLMFYSLLLLFIISKAAMFLKDTIGFSGSSEKMNQIVVQSGIAYFIVNAVIVLFHFISIDMIDWLRFVQPVLSGGAVFYLLFMGFSGEYEVEESKKAVFAGALTGLFVIVGIGINWLVFNSLGMSLLAAMFGGKF